MNILITGGAGFIGSHIADAYIRAGHHVIIVDNLSSGKRRNVPRGATLIVKDIRDASLKDVFRRHRIDAVNHHAAQMDVRRSVEDPAFDAQVNVMGLLNILNCARDHSVRKIIFASSGGTIYGETPRPAVETNYPRPLSPYGITKLAGEYYLQTYSALHGLRYTILRYANVYGPRQDPHGEAGVVAIFCRRMLSGEPVTIFGDGKQVRDYVFVQDIARMNLIALRRGDDAIFNVGTSQTTSVNQLFTHLKSLTDYPRKAVYRPKRPGELFRSCLSYAKARKDLGWAPAHTIVEGLKATVDYFAQSH
ncbi:MAG TPA: NAD-dependent epimerase/dehydratase family protein [Elusimicrobiota bacterium]|nr:NAD-dependent epimerase/dehydratase family protein [Elusimicrobiota bacterium]